MRLLVTGSRHFSSPELVWGYLSRAFVEYKGELELGFGDCPSGADDYALRFCRSVDVRYSRYEARWETLGKAAGPERNNRLVTEFSPDHAVGFLREGELNRGTLRCLSLVSKYFPDAPIDRVWQLGNLGYVGQR